MKMIILLFNTHQGEKIKNTYQKKLNVRSHSWLF